MAGTLGLRRRPDVRQHPVRAGHPAAADGGRCRTAGVGGGGTMSPVFRHGRLRLYLLKLLDEAPRHGYEVIRLLQDRFMGVYAPSPGTIYPRLARLEEEGLVTHDEADGRKIYRITDKGRAEIEPQAGRPGRSGAGDHRIGAGHRPRGHGGRQGHRAQPARGTDLGDPRGHGRARAGRGPRGGQGAGPRGPASRSGTAPQARGELLGRARRAGAREPEAGPSPCRPGRGVDRPRTARPGRRLASRTGPAGQAGPAGEARRGGAGGCEAAATGTAAGGGWTPRHARGDLERTGHRLRQPAARRGLADRGAGLRQAVASCARSWRTR